MVLAAFMGGLALGSFLLGGFANHTQNPSRLYAILQFGIAVLALLMPALLSITDAVDTVFRLRPDETLWGEFLRRRNFSERFSVA